MKRAIVWFALALFLNGLLLLLALYVVKEDFVMSLFYALLAILLLAALLVVKDRKLLVILHPAIAIVLIMGLLTVLFEDWPAFTDMILHFLGGFLASAYLLALYHEKLPGGWLLVAIGFCFGVSAGVIWEFAEWAGHLFTTHPGFAINGYDILSDLLCDSLGAMLSSLAFRKLGAGSA